MKTKILTMLRGTDDYISGQEICDRLGVSRTAVWKVINQLKEEGYVIEAVNNKGYRITEYPDILTQSELESAINIESANGEGTLAKKLVCRDIVDSTNNVARKLAEDMACHGTLVVAEQQTGGKGRFQIAGAVLREKLGYFVRIVQKCRRAELRLPVQVYG